MNDMEKSVHEFLEDMQKVSTNEDEQEYSILGYKDVPVLVPYARLSDATSRCAVLERLLRMEVRGNTILAFIARAKQDGRWG